MSLPKTRGCAGVRYDRENSSSSFIFSKGGRCLLARVDALVHSASESCVKIENRHREHGQSQQSEPSSPPPPNSGRTW